MKKTVIESIAIAAGNAFDDSHLYKSSPDKNLPEQNEADFSKAAASLPQTHKEKREDICRVFTLLFIALSISSFLTDYSGIKLVRTISQLF